MDYNHRIGRLELQFKLDDALLQELEDQFKEEAAKFLRQWWWDTTARLANRSQSHGPDGIATLKSRITELRGRAEEVAEEFLSDRSAWWHKKPREERDQFERYEFRSERIGPKKLDSSLRIAMGAVAPILRDFGYIEPRRESQWLEWDETGDHHPPNARHYYPYAVDWPEELLKTARSYADRVQQSANRMHDMAILKRQKKERESGQSWEGV